MRRIWTCLQALLILLSAAGPARAAEDRDVLLERAENLEAEMEKSLRSVMLHVQSGEEPDAPTEEDAPDAVFLKCLAMALESGWALAETETPDMPMAERRILYARMAEAELEALAPGAELALEDPLLDFLRRVYLADLRWQLDATKRDYADPIAFLWRWNGHRQEGLKALFFINRYYGVSIRKAFKDRMSSDLYEGALLISENTIAELIDHLDAGREAAASGDAEPAESAEAEDMVELGETFGGEVWHSEPTGKYAFRIFDFDREALTMQVELREAETENTVPCEPINLSAWEKYRKDRRVLDTFYKVGGIANEEGKLSFDLYINVLFDGRLYKELKGRISMRLPTAQGGGASAEAGQASDASFPEEAIAQDFTGLSLGDQILMGYYEQDGDAANLREPIAWKIISVNKKKQVALVMAVYGLDAVSYGTLGDEEAAVTEGFNWKNSYLRQWMNETFYTECFTSAEKARIRTVSNVTQDKSGRFTTKDQVFLLNTMEVKRYLKGVKGMVCEATPAARQKLAEGAVTKDGYCLWWIRDMVNAAVRDKKGNLKKGTRNLAGYVYGSEGLKHFLQKKGGEIYLDNQILVRPAMWIKLGELD